MKVYLVKHVDLETESMAKAVFSSKELAQQFIASHPPKYAMDMWIEPHVVDAQAIATQKEPKPKCSF